MQFIAVELFIYLLFIWSYSSVCLCKKQDIAKNGNTSLLLQHFGSNIGILFCLHIEKLILGCKTIWESFYEQFEVWVHFLIWTKKKHFFHENCTLVWSEFSDNYLYISPKNLKISPNFHKVFWEKKDRFLLSPNDICTPFDS